MKKILFTSPGRRFELISFFKEEFPGYEFIGADAFDTSPAGYILDRVYQMPFKIDEEYLNRLLEVCEKERPEFVIPLIDPELPLFSKHKKKFDDLGVHVWVPEYDVVELSNDKYLTYLKFKDTSVAVPETWLLKEYLEKNISASYDKLILKPAAGSSSKGIYKVSPKDVEKTVEAEEIQIDKYIVQEFVDFSDEITVDVYGDGEGNTIEYCLRKRIRTRGGEVEKGVTENNPKVSEFIKTIVKELKILGVVNIQVMIENGKITLGEINPRFGGGYPLSHKAGANMIQHIKAYMNKQPYEPINDIRYKNNFYVLRYDNAVYTDKLMKLI